MSFANSIHNGQTFSVYDRLRESCSPMLFLYLFMYMLSLACLAYDDFLMAEQKTQRISNSMA